MSGEHELASLLASMDPELRRQRFVFTTTPQAPHGIEPVAGT